MATVGKIVAVLTATTKPFERGMKRAGKATKDMASKVTGLTAKMAQWAAAMVVVGVGASALLVRRQRKASGTIDQM